MRSWRRLFYAAQVVRTPHVCAYPLWPSICDFFHERDWGSGTDIDFSEDGG